MHVPSSITYHPGEPGRLPMRHTALQETPDLRFALDVLREGEEFGFHRLATFAQQRHGWGNSNSGFGITYPTDLDEYDLAQGAVPIPEGHVEMYRFWGEASEDTLVIPERDYLTLLLRAFEARSMETSAQAIRQLLG